MSSPPIVDFAPTDAARFGPKLVALTALSKLGVPIPPFFALDADTCALARQSEQLPIAVKQAITEAIAKLERKTDRRFGDPTAPLLVSVRASTRTRMSAVLSKVLDVGLTERTMPGLVAQRGRRFALDCQLHLLRTLGEAQMARPHGAQTSPFSAACADARRLVGATTTGELDTPVLEGLLATYRAIYAREGVALPSDDPWEQLFRAISMVSRSWRSPAAIEFRRAQQIPEEPGPALAITAMVFGNADNRSASGIALSRHASTGGRGPSGEYLLTAQGDELGAGHGQPLPLAAADASTPEARARSLEARLPEPFTVLGHELTRVERHLGVPVEIEFAIESGHTWVLHAQAASLSTTAHVRATVDLATEGIISEVTAVRTVRPADLAAVMRPSVEPVTETGALFAKGLPASAGACTGRLTLSAADVIARAGRGESAIFVCVDTTPADGAAVRAAKGLVTTRGGTTSDAAIMARALGRPCIVSARGLTIDSARRTVTARDQTLRDGDPITVDGGRGEVLVGRRSTVAPPSLTEASRLLGWADAARAIDVRAIVETAEEVTEARAAGAHGFLVHRLSRWLRADLADVLRAAGERSLALRLPTSADPDMDLVRLNAVIEAAPSRAGEGLELLVDGLGWNLHPRLLKLRARLREANLGHARVGVWIDTEVDLKSLVGPASPLAAVDVVVVELSTMARRSLPPRANSSIPPISSPGFAPAASNDSARRLDPTSPLARVLPVVEASRALGDKGPAIGVVAPLSGADPDLGPAVHARLAFVGVTTRELPLVRLAAGRAGSLTTA